MARLVAVAGGKGGVGKSLLAANLGMYLAQIGRRVALIDADPHGAALPALCGMAPPPPPLLSGAPDDTLVPITPAGLRVGAAGESADVAAIVAALADLPEDYVVLDLPPGADARNQDLFLAAGTRVLIVVPEPIAIEGAFGFLRKAFARAVARLPGAATLPLAPPPLPFDLLAEARGLDEALAEGVLRELRAMRLLLVVNHARARADLDLPAALCATARRRAGVPAEALGAIESDEAVSLSVRKRRPVLLEYPEARMSKNVERVARRLLALDAPGPAPTWTPRRPDELTLYELLEVDPGSTEEEIRRAYRRARELYAPDSLAICGLYARGELDDLARRVQDAYDTLIDNERRRVYDRTAFPAAPTPPPRPSAPGPLPLLEVPSRPAGPEPEIGPGTAFSGELLRRVREARGIELADISRRTKIGVPYLRAIEEERFSALPAVVYVRGFLVEYARCLHLDAERVTATYLPRLRQAGHE